MILFYTVLFPLYHNGSWGLHDFICLGVVAIFLIVVFFVIPHGVDDEQKEKTQAAESKLDSALPEKASDDRLAP